METIHPNVLVAQHFWSAIAEGDAAALEALLSDDVVWHVSGGHPLSGSYRGPDAVCEYLARVGEAADDLVTTLDSIFHNDEGVVVTYHASATRGQRKLEMNYFLRLTIRDGRVAEANSVAVDQHETGVFWK